MSGSRLLIVNADDFGRSPGINQGILEAHRHGIVTSTTLMVSTPFAESAARAAADSPHLGIGLHLNYCYGVPVSKPALVRSLVDRKGVFITSIEEILGAARPDDILRKRARSLIAFATSSVDGRLISIPTSTCTHQSHSGALSPGPQPITASRSGRPGWTTGRYYPGWGSGPRIIFEGRFHGLDGEGVDMPLLETILRGIEPGVTELMCHPGIVDQHIADSSYTRDRERELVALCDPGIRRLIHELEITLTHFGIMG